MNKQFFSHLLSPKIRAGLNYLQYRLLPNICLLCGSFTDNNTAICLCCKADLPWHINACLQCGQNLHTTNSHCGSCLKNPPYYDRTYAIFYYQPPVTQLIIRLKFQHKLANARLLAELMYETINRNYAQQKLPDLLIPVPLHIKRLQERGFNQTVEIARPVAKKLKIPLDTTSCQRIRNTQAQSSVAASERYENIKNAFCIADNFQADHVAIIDDVVTTHNTVNELSRMLKKAGVKQIDVWCCGRNVLK